MKTKYTSLFFIIFLCFIPKNKAFAQEILDKYIQEAFEKHPQIQQQQHLIQKSKLAHQEARNLWLPTAKFNTTYTLAQGGRTIGLPLGDLFNPAYSTLNTLTNTRNFPTLENQNIQFLPNNFYDAKFNITQAIYNQEISFNQKIKKEQIQFQSIEINQIKRTLVKDIKTAYFQYVQAGEAVRIYEEAKKLVEEAQRVNEILIKNDLATPLVRTRTQSQMNKINAQLLEAQANEKNAVTYFNFLLQQPENAPVTRDTSLFYLEKIQLSEGNESQVSTREEIQKLQSAENLQNLNLRLQKSYFLPKLGASLDLGSQAFEWQFNKQSRYYLLGISLDIPIFAGFRNKLKIQQAQSDIDALKSQTKHVQNQLELQANIAKNNLNASKAITKSTLADVELTKRTYQDILKRYKQGTLPYIDLLDAQNDMILAQIQHLINLGKVQIRYAELEYALGTYKVAP